MMHLDADQAAAVASASHTVVAAGAGSGKTRVLVERYVRLVLKEGCSLPEILAVTFTRKAAAEMRERIYRRLQMHQDQSHVREQLARFDEAQIQTFDSLCGEILRSAAGHLGLSPDFVVDDDGVSERAFAPTMRYVLEGLHDPVLQDLVARFGLLPVVEEFFINRLRDSFHLSQSVDFEDAARVQETALRRRAEAAVEQMTQALKELASVTLPSNLQASQDRDAVVRLSHLFDDGVDTDTIAPLMAAIGALRKPRSNAKAVEAAVYREAMTHLQAQAELCRGYLATLAVSDDIARAFDSLRSYGKEAELWKRHSGTVGYADVVFGAMTVLSEVPELRASYHGRLRHILVDEFQDNNQSQRNLIYLLAGLDTPETATSTTLFLVGDDKQSIYRFRGAEASLFRSVAEDVGRRGGVTVPLRYNYRSDGRLVRFFNRLFAEVLSEAAGSFETVESPRGDTGHGTVGVLVHETDILEDSSGGKNEHLDGAESEAYVVAQTLSRLVEDGTLEIGDDQNRRHAGYNDIAVLMRSTSNQNAFERMFRLFSIPYQSRSVRGLFTEAIVSDIYYLLRLVVQPDDRTAYAAVLRSPLVSVSDEALVTILTAGGPLFGEVFLSAEDAGRYAAGAETYRLLCEESAHAATTDLLELIWTRLGYRYHYQTSARGRSYLEHYEYLYRFALLRPEEGLASFLLRLQEHLGEYRRLPELDAPREASEGLQLMSVHQAKGLEFPVVVVVDAANTGRRDRPGEAPAYHTERYGLVVNVSGGNGKHVHALAREAKEENAALNREEMKRLLYVACTRAEDHLIVSGRCGTREHLKKDNLLAFLMDGLSSLGYQGESDAPVDPAGVVSVEYLPRVHRRHVAQGTESMRTVRDYLAVVSDRQAPPRRFPLRETTATELSEGWWRRHEVDRRALAPELERLPAMEIDSLLQEAHREALFGEVIHRTAEIYARNYALPGGIEELRLPGTTVLEEPEVGQAMFEVARAIVGEQLVRDIGPELFAPSKDGSDTTVIKTETPFLLRRNRGTETAIIRGKIDFLLLRDESVRIVDFKTDRYLDPDRHGVQLAVYCCAAREIFGRPAEGALYYVRGGRLVDVDVAGFEREIDSLLV